MNIEMFYYRASKYFVINNYNKHIQKLFTGNLCIELYYECNYKKWIGWTKLNTLLGDYVKDLDSESIHNFNFYRVETENNIISSNQQIEIEKYLAML